MDAPQSLAPALNSSLMLHWHPDKHAVRFTCTALHVYSFSPLYGTHFHCLSPSPVHSYASLPQLHLPIPPASLYPFPPPPPASWHPSLHLGPTQRQGGKAVTGRRGV